MGSGETNWRRVYTLRDFGGVLFRQSRVAIVVFLAVITAAVVMLLVTPDKYQSELRLLVKHDRADTLITNSPGSDRAMPPDVTEQELNSEMELLQGPDLLRQVAATSGLVGRESDRGWWRTVDDVKRSIGLANAKEQAASSREIALSRAVDELRGDLSVAPVRRTWMISVTYTSPDPTRSKAVLDSLTRLYLEKHLLVRRPPGTRQFFVEQAAQSAEELQAAQKQLRDFGQRRGTVSAMAEKEAALAKIADFEGQLRQTDAALSEATARLTTLQLERARTPTRNTATVTTGDATGFTQEMQSKIAAMEMRRTELLQKYTPQYRLVVDIDEQIAQAKSALDGARTSSLKQETTAENPTMRWLENEIARVRIEHSAQSARHKALASSLATYRSEAQTMQSADLEQSDLLRNLKAAQDKYVLYQQKEEEARISDALDRTRISNVAIVQVPMAPTEPLPRRSMMWLSIALVVALFLSLSAAVITDILSASVRIRTPDELQTTLADVPVLAWVPAASRRA